PSSRRSDAPGEAASPPCTLNKGLPVALPSPPRFYREQRDRGGSYLPPPSSCTPRRWRAAAGITRVTGDEKCRHVTCPVNCADDLAVGRYNTRGFSSPWSRKMRQGAPAKTRTSLQHFLRLISGEAGTQALSDQVSERANPVLRRR